MIGDRICPMCRATVRVDLAQATAVCTACDTRFLPAIAAKAVPAPETAHAIETTSATAIEHKTPGDIHRDRIIGGVLAAVASAGVLNAALTLGASPKVAVVIMIATAFAASAWHEWRFRRPVLPGAIAALRRNRRRSLPPLE